MKDGRFLSMRGRLAPALLLLAFALTAKGEDLLDVVLNASPASGETNETSAALADTEDFAPPIGGGTSAEFVPIAGHVAREHIDRPKTFCIRGGSAPSSYSRLISAEWIQPLNDSPFEMNLRALILYASETDVDEAENQGVEALGMWRPWRSETVSPFVGLGLRYESFSRQEEYEDEDDASATIVGRIGVLLKLDCLFIVGECIVGSNSCEIIGDVSFYISRRTKLHLFIDDIDLDLCDAKALGLGLSWDF